MEKVIIYLVKKISGVLLPVFFISFMMNCLETPFHFLPGPSASIPDVKLLWLEGQRPAPLCARKRQRPSHQSGARHWAAALRHRTSELMHVTCPSACRLRWWFMHVTQIISSPPFQGRVFADSGHAICTVSISAQTPGRAIFGQSTRTINGFYGLSFWLLIKFSPCLSWTGHITRYLPLSFAAYKMKIMLLGSWTAVKIQGVPDCSLEHRLSTAVTLRKPHLQESIRHLKRDSCCAFSNHHYRKFIYFRTNETESKRGMGSNTWDTLVTCKGVSGSIASISCYPDNTASCRGPTAWVPRTGPPRPPRRTLWITILICQQLRVEGSSTFQLISFERLHLWPDLLGCIPCW